MKEKITHRANANKLRDVFNKYATVEKQGEKYITNEDFVRKFLELYEHGIYTEESAQLIAGIADKDSDGLISFADFQAFEGLLCMPDALYRIAFQLFDADGSQDISFQKFENVIQNTAAYQKLPYNMNSDFVHMYFGKDKSRTIKYTEFSQFLHDFNEDCGIEIFKTFDQNWSGSIDKSQFRDIMLSVNKYLMTKDLEIRLAAGFPENYNTITYAYYTAFNSLLKNMALIKRIFLHATNDNRNEEVSLDEFLASAQLMSQITPMEIDILFKLCATLPLGQKPGHITFQHLNMLTAEQYYKSVTKKIAAIKAVSSPNERSFVIQWLENMYRFILGAIGGAAGAAAVYPVDFVKTRIQNQRPDKILYVGYLDCFKKVIQNEGILGLYKGLIPQLCGVAPEKAIKLSVHDFVRDKLSDKDGRISLFRACFAGGCGGFCQVIVTCPLEIVKIRLQVAGEVKEAKKITAMSVAKDLGLRGLFKGASACWLRDVTFSSIYFPSYIHFKAMYADENGYNSPFTLLMAGVCAALPAVTLATPMDVIKTRMQVIPRPGQTVYNGVLDTTRKIWNEEGMKAFWKGTLARVCRSSPQFGITLASYEVLQRLFYIDFGGTRPSGSQVIGAIEKAKPKPQLIGGYQAAQPILEGLTTKFGISLPRWSSNKPVDSGSGDHK